MQSQAGEGERERGACEGAWAKAQSARSGQDSWNESQTGKRHDAPSPAGRSSEPLLPEGILSQESL